MMSGTSTNDKKKFKLKIKYLEPILSFVFIEESN
jgi:hypothetical protein